MWVSKQIQLYKDFRNGKTSRSISDERIAELNAIGFEWTINPLAIRTGIWQDKFERLCDFQREYGHCRVPFGFVVDSVNIGMWVARQRKLYNNFMNGKKPASITGKRIAELNALGFEWKINPVIT